MIIGSGDVILRDLIASDAEDEVRWMTEETGWISEDSPWETVEPVDAEALRREMRELVS